MNKRKFLKGFLSLAGVVTAPVAAGRVARHTRSPSPLIQTSPLAGFQHYEGERLWPKMHSGDRLKLRHVPSNPYDNRAVEIRWNGNMIGYLPRQENIAISQMLYRGEMLYGVLAEKYETDNLWERIRVEVWCDSNGFMKVSKGHESEWGGRGYV